MHFTPFDHNWPYGPATDATSPGQPTPDQNNPPVETTCKQSGSIIGCQDQVLGEAIDITGTPFRLHYQSDRVPGRKEAYILKIPLSGATVPGSLKSIILNVFVAGRSYTYNFPAAPDQVQTFIWDGKDAYGRILQGNQPVTTRIGYVYEAVYQSPALLTMAFGALSGIPISADRARNEITIWQEWKGSIGPWNNILGKGWSLNVHHNYDPEGRVLYQGDGGKRSGRGFYAGVIATAAGTEGNGFAGDGGPAVQAQLNYIRGVVVGADGSIYFGDNDNHRVRRVGPDGIITTVAGTGIGGFAGDGGPAVQAQLTNPREVAAGVDGSIYIADSGNYRVRRVGTDGIITTVAGNGGMDFTGDGGPAAQAQIAYIVGVAQGADGSIYIVDGANSRVRRIKSVMPGLSLTDFFIPSEDGSEIYIFSNSGRHLRTLEALTGTVRYNFTYDSAGRLTAITDEDDNIVTIERDAQGTATAIVSPYGQRTNLMIDPYGYLASITDPTGEPIQFSYTSDGLLTSMTDPRNNIYRFSYDELGRLIKDEDPAGGSKTLSRLDIVLPDRTGSGYSVNLSTGLNRNTTYGVLQLSTGDQKLRNTFPDGLSTETLIGTNGTQTVIYPDGTRTTQVHGPDPRFGMQAPVTKSMTIKTPAGLTQTITGDRTASLLDPDDLLSLATLTDTTSINGRTFTGTFDAAARNITSQTPMGRNAITTLDNKGRVIESQVPGIIPVQYSYDSRGRLSNINQGTRNYGFSYDVNGNLASITDPMMRSGSFEYDAAGRVTRQTLTDGRQIQYTYDESGNVLSITPPGRPDHNFTYTPVDLIEKYLPPDVGVPNQTRYTYNIDRDLTRVTRPDGATIDLGYDSAGRLNTTTYPEGTTSFAYDHSTGNLNLS